MAVELAFRCKSEYYFGYKNGQFTSRSHKVDEDEGEEEDDEEEYSHVFCYEKKLAVGQGKGERTAKYATDCGGVMRLDAGNRHTCIIHLQSYVLRTENYRKYSLLYDSKV